MAKKRAALWALNPDDLSWGWHGASSGKRGQFARQLKTTSASVFVTHRPTGIRVEGQIPDGHYSKQQMQARREQLARQLVSELEQKVAQQLHIKGR